MRGTKLTFKGVIDLTSRQTSLESANNEVGISGSEQGMEIEELVIREEEYKDDDGTSDIDQGSRCLLKKTGLSLIQEVSSIYKDDGTSDID